MALVFDLHEVFKDFWDAVKLNYILLIEPKETPPNNRTPNLAYLPLQRQGADGVVQELGVFIPEFYEYALQGKKDPLQGLRCQREHQKWMNANVDADATTSPYYAESQKEAFELALLPIIFSEDNPTCTLKIEKAAMEEFHYRKQEGLPVFVAPINKYRIKTEYLRNMEAVGLESPTCRAIYVNVNNPEKNTNTRERTIHWLAQLAAYCLGMLAALSFTSLTGPWLVALSMVGGLAAHWSVAAFTTFDIGESIYRSIDWVFNKHSWQGDISLKQLLKVTLLLSVAGYAAYGSALAVAAETAGLLSSTLPAFAVGSLAFTAVEMAKLGLVALSASVVGVGTFLGLTGAQHFFWGLSIWHKQIALTKAEVDALQAPKSPEGKIHSKWNKIDHNLNKITTILAQNPEFAATEEGQNLVQAVTEVRNRKELFVVLKPTQEKAQKEAEKRAKTVQQPTTATNKIV